MTGETGGGAWSPTAVRALQGGPRRAEALLVVGAQLEQRLPGLYLVAGLGQADQRPRPR